MSNIVIKDESGNPVEHFYQWDMNRVITFTGTGIPESFQVHFSNKCRKDALVVLPDMTGENPTANVPNLILQNPDTLYIYIYDTVNNVYKTDLTFRVLVVPRSKPSDYQYVEHIESITVDTILNQISDTYVQKDGNKGLSTNDYTTGDKNKVSQIRSIRNDELEIILI